VTSATTPPGWRVTWLDTCASTNDVAAARARAGEPEGWVVVADTQTAGRGRLGRTWHSPPGTNLYVSLLLRPLLPAVQVAPLTLVVGAATAAALAREGAVPRLKWPNDVLLGTPAGPRKVAGILTEAASEANRMRHVIVGIGLNVNSHRSDFPTALAARVTSLRQTLGRSVDREGLLARLLGELGEGYARFLREGPAAAIASWRRYADLGGRYRVQGVGAADIEGVAEDVEADGALRVRGDDGRVHRVVTGEVVDSPAP